MAVIPKNIVDEVRNSINIVDVIGQYTTLQRRGKNLMGLCPFQEEKTPSFSVREDQQYYHCFGCGRAGNVFNFVEEIEGLTFPQAVAKVAEEANYPLEKQYQQVENNLVTDEQKELFALNEDASKLYHYLLVKTKVGEEALNYLKNERHLSDELIEKFQIGYAPRDSRLLDLLKEREVSQEKMLASTLITSGNNGQLRDFFSGRIIFPLRDAKGNVAGFSGRTLDKQNPAKYLNSPETVVFKKSELLFNLDLASSEIRKERKAYLFEGFMDVLSAYNAGIKNSIAAMGTAFGESQMKIINRLTKELIVAFDGDLPGQENIWRVIQEYNKSDSDFSISAVVFPEKLDPDEYLQKYGNSQFKALLSQEQKSVPEFALSYFSAGKDFTKALDRRSFLNNFLPVLSEVESEVDRKIYFDNISSMLNVDSETISNELSKWEEENSDLLKKSTTKNNEVQIKKNVNINLQPIRRDATEKAEQLLLLSMLKYDSVWKSIDAGFEFHHLPYQQLYLIGAGYKANTQGEFNAAEFIQTLKNEDNRRLFAEMLDDESLAKSITSDKKIIQDYLFSVELGKLNDDTDKLTQEMNESSKSGDVSKTFELSKKISELKKKQRELKGKING